MTNRPFFCRPLAALTIAASLSACAQSTPQFDQGFGATVRDAISSQVAHPAAVGNTDPVVGIDGRSAVLALDRYQKSFGEQAAKPATFMIGGGGAR